VEVAEDFFGPEVDAAFAGIAVGEFDDGDALGPEEEDEGDNPEPDGDAAVGGDGGDDVEVEDGDDEEEDEVAASEGADELGVGGLWLGGQVVVYPQRLKPLFIWFVIAALKRCATQKQIPHPGFARVRNDKCFLDFGRDSRGRLSPHEHFRFTTLVRDRYWGLAFLLSFR
jgi:hypothetical protein